MDDKEKKKEKTLNSLDKDIQKISQEYEQSLLKVNRLMTEVTDLFSHSDDRHFFYEQQEVNKKYSRQAIDQLNEKREEVRKRSRQLEEREDEKTQ